MQTHYTQKDIERFWMKVDKQSSNIFYNGTRCWEWTARLSERGGYGEIKWGTKTGKAHRIAYELVFGEVPESLFVCHGCDNPSCCNPDHLFAGTHQDNMDDMNRKGRGVNFVARGENHVESKLTDLQVSEIRRRYGSGKENQSQLAKAFGVSQGLIWRIVKSNYRS